MEIQLRFKFPLCLRGRSCMLPMLGHPHQRENARVHARRDFAFYIRGNSPDCLRDTLVFLYTQGLPEQERSRESAGTHEYRQSAPQGLKAHGQIVQRKTAAPRRKRLCTPHVLSARQAWVPANCSRYVDIRGTTLVVCVVSWSSRSSTFLIHKEEQMKCHINRVWRVARAAGVGRPLFCTESALGLFLRERRKEARRCAILLERNVRMEKKRILVADDDTLTREIVAKLLQEEGYDVALATDGQEAITLVSIYCPDLVLTDLSMPRLSGIGVLARVRRVTPTTPVIIFTSETTPEVEQEARQLGARDYIHKPFDIDDLLKRITWALMS